MKKTIALLLAALMIILPACSKKSDSGSQGQQGSKTAQEETAKNRAIDFELTRLSGDKAKLSSLEGKVVVLNFFATWCPPCKAELPGFMQTMEKYKGSDVVFLFIDVDEDSKTLEAFVKSRNYTEMNPLMDVGGVVSNEYNVRGIPSTFIINKNGEIAAAHEGYMDDAALKAAIEEARK